LPDAVKSIPPFAVSLGIELAAADPAEVRGSMAWAEERCTAAERSVVQTELVDDDRRAVGLATQTQAVLRKEGR
jgi:hypothetical protein